MMFEGDIAHSRVSMGLRLSFTFALTPSPMPESGVGQDVFGLPMYSLQLRLLNHVYAMNLWEPEIIPLQ